MIRLESISLTFFKNSPLSRTILENLTFSIPKGQFVTVIGSNGAGKSTLLNVITGLLPVDEGQVFINNLNVTSWRAEERSPYVARVFQDPLAGSCASLTVAENMALAHSRGHRLGLKKALTSDRQALFRQALKELQMDLERYLDQPMGLLSGGQRQAISLVMAVLSPSSILILDEHTAALDPKTTSLIIKQTQELVARKKLTTLMVTHSMHQALEVGDRTIMLHKGKILHDFNERERKDLSSTDLLKLFEEMDD